MVPLEHGPGPERVYRRIGSRRAQCASEDFHVVHHHAPNTHWTDAPAHFEANKDKYASVTATIFRNTEEGKLLQWLFERNWDSMAEHFVDLNGKLTHEDPNSDTEMRHTRTPTPTPQRRT